MLTLLKIKVLKWRIKILVTRYHRAKNPIGSGRKKKEIYCHECSKAGGADMPIYHLPPECKPHQE